MRITAQAKAETQERIVATARQLFLSKGFDKTTIRDIAAEAQIGIGTLFNYFPNKEALAMFILAQGLHDGAATYHRRRRGTESLAEDLFAYILAGLRELKPARHYIGEVIESAFSPFAKHTRVSHSQQVRQQHLETVIEIIQTHVQNAEVTYITLHLYWILYIGVLAFWSNDDSPNQEDTLVVLDQAMRLFSGSLKPTIEV
ncbi:MAG TPA: TetR/AcrR family transcriptional regulator [Acidobacteriota bacterium]|nr:TetR/AcrR family transcriptional regulator [Acidobacteriota bacterium]HNH85202.1 TetR/AcrR family transcriptional regulator [Acidobacteriota bacterium]